LKRSTVFPARLRQLISSANITQKQLAEAVGLKPQSISQYLDGASTPSYSTLVDIADYFHVSTDYLLGRSDVITDDMSISAIGSQLGLSEKSVSEIQEHSQIIERLLSHEQTQRLFKCIASFHDYSMNAYIEDVFSETYRLLAGHELREAGFLLGEIFRAKNGEKAFLEWKIELISGEAPRNDGDGFRITIPENVTTEEIEKYLAKQLIEEATRRERSNGKA